MYQSSEKLLQIRVLIADSGRLKLHYPLRRCDGRDIPFPLEKGCQPIM
jgi:hypothetical protein